MLGCMRNAPATAVIQNQDRFFDVLPRVDGVLLPDRPDVLFAENGAPALIIGTDREEDAGGLFDLYGMPAEDWDEFLLSLLGPDLAAMAAELYPFAEYDSPWLAFVTGSTDVNRTCPTRDMALAAAQTAPVYRYLYTHAFERPDDFGFDLPVYRASHAFEEPFLWHDFDGWEYTPSAAEDRLSDIMADYWTNFAKTGNPNGGDLVLWPTYDATTEALLFLDVSPVAGAAYHVPHCAFAQFLYQ